METFRRVLQVESEERRGTGALVQVACVWVEEMKSMALAGWTVGEQGSWLAEDGTEWGA